MIPYEPPALTSAVSMNGGVGDSTMHSIPPRPAHLDRHRRHDTSHSLTDHKALGNRASDNWCLPKPDVSNITIETELDDDTPPRTHKYFRGEMLESEF